MQDQQPTSLSYVNLPAEEPQDEKEDGCWECLSYHSDDICACCICTWSMLEVGFGEKFLLVFNFNF